MLETVDLKVLLNVNFVIDSLLKPLSSLVITLDRNSFSVAGIMRSLIEKSSTFAWKTET